MKRVDHLLRRLFHVDDETVDLGHEVVVADRHRNRDDEPSSGGQKRDLNTTGNQCRLNLTRRFDRLERDDHADHGTQEAEERRNVRERRENDEPLLELAHLDEALVLDRLHDAIGAFLVTLETGVQDVGRRRIGVTRELESFADALLHEKLIDILQNALGRRGFRRERHELDDDDDDAEEQDAKKEVGENVPLGRMGIPEDLEGTAVFLASNDSDYITAQTINVDGGNWMS